jgi:hypothetical protein
MYLQSLVVKDVACYVSALGFRPLTRSYPVCVQLLELYICVYRRKCHVLLKVVSTLQPWLLQRFAKCSVGCLQNRSHGEGT